MQGPPRDRSAVPGIEMSLAWSAIINAAPSWPATAGAVAWALAMLALTPVADWIASRWIRKPPNLDVFRQLQQSRTKLIIGIVIAWVLGAFLEELVFRGVIQQWIERSLAAALSPPVATIVAVLVAAIGAGVLHLYQGLRAAVIITQLSVLFGVLFVLSGRNLWSVFLCHGIYDTVAFIRFANRQSKYSRLAEDETPS
jgi:membrane protease YdiL (CAAX protease family)